MPKSMQQHSHEALNFIVPISCEYGKRDAERERGVYVFVYVLQEWGFCVTGQYTSTLSHTYTLTRTLV